MHDSHKKKHTQVRRRAIRTRAKIKGTSECPRLSVFRSLQHIYVQAIDDVNNRTIAAATDKGIKSGKPVAKAQLVGESLGKQLVAKKIEKAIFDKGPYKYHGQVKALADGIRQVGVKF